CNHHGHVRRTRARQRTRVVVGRSRLVQRHDARRDLGERALEREVEVLLLRHRPYATVRSWSPIASTSSRSSPMRWTSYPKSSRLAWRTSQLWWKRNPRVRCSGSTTACRKRSVEAGTSGPCPT